MSFEDKLGIDDGIIKQDKLKELLLEDKISGAEFLGRVFCLDQTGDHTQEAESNIKLLSNTSVKEKLLKGGLAREYYNMMSLSYFHQGQKTLKPEYFKKALEFAMKNSHFENYFWWIYYIKGTLAFFEKDKESLEKAIKHTNERSKVILKCLLEALNQGAEPEKYKEICSNCKFE